MSFRDNLIHLRAANNMTQEQLAMMVGVSRQSVAKWESGKSYPEMDKLITMSQIFKCTLDELVQGDLTEREAEPSLSATVAAEPLDVFGYDEHMRAFANKIANGVMAILLGVAVSISFYGLSDHGLFSSLIDYNILIALGLICIFVGVIVGLSFLIPAGMEHSAFVRKHPYLEDFYTDDDRVNARKSFVHHLILGLLFIFAGISVVIVFADTSYEAILGVPIMMIGIAFGVRALIYGGIMLSHVDIETYNRTAGEILTADEIAQSQVDADQKEAMMRVHNTDKRVGAVCGSIMIIATIVALLMLFIPMATGSYDYTTGPVVLFWLPWVLGGLLCGVATLLLKK